MGKETCIKADINQEFSLHISLPIFFYVCSALEKQEAGTFCLFAMLNLLQGGSFPQLNKQWGRGKEFNLLPWKLSLSRDVSSFFPGTSFLLMPSVLAFMFSDPVLHWCIRLNFMYSVSKFSSQSGQTNTPFPDGNQGHHLSLRHKKYKKN